MSKWILVNERLPEKEGIYLVSGKNQTWICEYQFIGNLKGWCNSIRNPCVEAWMPLPEPYTEEEETISAMVVASDPTVLTIPENPTNGDMIKAMFPKADIEYWAEYSAYSVIFPFDNDVKYFSYDWWNAPYKAESDKESEK